jgi:hypothetical protein
MPEPGVKKRTRYSNRMPKRQTAPAGNANHRTVALRERIIELWMDSDNDELTNKQRAAKLKISWQTYKYQMSPELMDQIIVARRASYSHHILPIDTAMINMAKRGSLPHAELFYERTEGYLRKAPKAAADMQIEKEVWDVVGTEHREQLADTLAAALRGRHDRIPDGHQPASLPGGDDAVGVFPAGLGVGADLGQGGPDPSVQMPAEPQRLSEVRSALAGQRTQEGVPEKP